jgi:hypothetical protein
MSSSARGGAAVFIVSLALVGAPASPHAETTAESDPRWSGGLGLTLLSSLFDDTGRTIPWEGDSLTNETRPLHAVCELLLPGADDRLWLSFRGTLGYTRSEIEPVKGTTPAEQDGRRTLHGDGRTWRWGLRGGLRYVLDATPTWHFATYGLAGFDRLSRVKHEEYLTDEGPASSAEGELVQSVSLTVGMMAERPLAHGISFRLWFDALDVRYLLEGHSSDLSDDDGTATLGDRTELGAALNLLAELAYAF